MRCETSGGLRDTRVTEILASIEALPSPPAVVTRLLGLLDDPDTGAEELESVITTDSALTARLLRLANSSFFGFSGEIASVQQAVMVIGTRRLFDVVASITLTHIVPRVIPCYELDAHAFWRHCLGVAVIGEETARELQLPAPDMLFTAGLLHDIGKLVIGSYLKDDAEALRVSLDASEETLVHVEREVLGADHAAIGAAQARVWGLPETIVDAARWHHDPEEIPSSVDRLTVDIVHVADLLAHAIGMGADVGELSRRVSGPASERLGLSPERLDAVACEALEKIETISTLIGSMTGV